MMLDFRPKEPQEEWAVEGVHANKLPGLCLAGASTSKGGYGVLASCSTKTDLRVYSSAGRSVLDASDHADDARGLQSGAGVRGRGGADVPWSVRGWQRWPRLNPSPSPPSRLLGSMDTGGLNNYMATIRCSLGGCAAWGAACCMPAE